MTESFDLARARSDVYRNLTGGVLLGCYTVTWEPDCLVLRPIDGHAALWHMSDEIAVGWDPDGFDPKTRQEHTKDTVVLTIYPAKDGIECPLAEAKGEVELTSEPLTSGVRLMVFIVEWLLATGRVVASDYLNAVAPINRPMNE